MVGYAVVAGGDSLKIFATINPPEWELVADEISWNMCFRH